MSAPLAWPAFFVGVICAAAVVPYGELQEQLRTGYNDDYIPTNFNQPLDVQLGVAFRHMYLDITQSTLQLSVWLRLKWYDDRLNYDGKARFGDGWDSSKHYVPFDVVDGPNEILWTPDVYCSNALGDPWGGFAESGAYVYDTKYSELNNSSSKFNIFWSRPGSITTKCELDLTQFPFDTQECVLAFESWKYSSTYLKILPMDIGAQTVYGSTTEDYEFIGVEHMEMKSEYETVEEEFSSAHVKVRLRRMPHYYVTHSVLPMTIIVVLATLTAWLPFNNNYSGAGERLSYGITLLLTIMATILFTAEKLPPVKKATWLDQFQSCCILLTILPILETVLVLYLDNLYQLVFGWSTEKETPVARRSLTPERPSNISILSGRKQSTHEFLSKRMHFESLYQEVQMLIRVSPLTIDRIFRHSYPLCIIGVAMYLMSQIDDLDSFLGILFKSGSTSPLTVCLVFLQTFFLIAMFCALCFASRKVLQKSKEGDGTDSTPILDKPEFGKIASLRGAADIQNSSTPGTPAIPDASPVHMDTPDAGGGEESEIKPAKDVVVKVETHSAAPSMVAFESSKAAESEFCETPISEQFHSAHSRTQREQEQLAAEKDRGIEQVAEKTARQSVCREQSFSDVHDVVQVKRYDQASAAATERPKLPRTNSFIPQRRDYSVTNDTIGKRNVHKLDPAASNQAVELIAQAYAQAYAQAAPPSQDASISFKLRAALSLSQCKELSVDWDKQVPVISNVQAGGAVESLGICPGDVIYSLNGVATSGQGRRDLLSALRGRPPKLELFAQFGSKRSNIHESENERPLILEIHRKAVEPYIELCVPLHLDNSGESGLELVWDGPLPRVAEVKEGSPAWKAGFFFGDRIFKANSQPPWELRRILDSVLEPDIAFSNVTLHLMVWRWPDTAFTSATAASSRTGPSLPPPPLAPVASPRRNMLQPPGASRGLPSPHTMPVPKDVPGAKSYKWKSGESSGSTFKAHFKTQTR